jgi:protein phosphatase
MEPNSFEFNVLPKVEHAKTPLKNIEMNGKSVACENHPDINEDAMFSNKEKRIFGVFDGMSGETEAHFASQSCNESVENSLLKYLTDNLTLSEVDQKLMDAFSTANNKLIKDTKKYRPDLVGSAGSFGTICYDEKGNLTAEILNVGDVRIYRFRDGKLEQMSLDDGILTHKYSEDQAKKYQEKFSTVTSADQLTPSEKKDFSQRNAISKFFGLENVQPTIYSIGLQPGDRLLLFTDGIHDNLTDLEITNILNKKNNSSSTATELINKSVNRSRESRQENFRAKKDDMTAFVIDVEPELPKDFVPVIGNAINVQRSSGQVETDWKIINIRDDRLVVRKEENGQTLDKMLPINYVARFNRQPKIEDISTAPDFHQLSFTLKKMDGLQGSSEFYTSENLLNKIKQVRHGELTLDSITRTAGLRDTVSFLMNRKNKK